MTEATSQLNGQLNEIRRRARELISGLTDEQIRQRPHPAKWSIAECLVHLNLSAGLIQPKIAAAIEQGKREKVTGTGPFSPGPLGRLLIWIVTPPPKFRIRAMKNISPPVVIGDLSQMVAEFMTIQDRWQELAREAEGLDQSKVKVAHLFPGLPRLRLAVPIPWMMAHQERHLFQAENVRRQILSAAPNSSARAV